MDAPLLLLFTGFTVRVDCVIDKKNTTKDLEKVQSVFDKQQLNFEHHSVCNKVPWQRTPLVFCLSVTLFPFFISQHRQTENDSMRHIENSLFHNFKDFVTRFSLPLPRAASATFLLRY